MALILLIGVPALEIWTLAQIGERIGWVDTLLALLGVGVLGVALARNEGLMVVERIRGAVAQGLMPEREILDGLLVLLAGALLVLPGFVSDALALLILFPVTRPAFRAVLRRRLRGRLQRVARVQVRRPPGQDGPFPPGMDPFTQRPRPPVRPDPTLPPELPGADTDSQPPAGPK
jgi:UPF0716 protein FxsA